MHVESGAQILEVGKAADEQAGADQKQQRKTHLCGHQRFAPARMAPPATAPA